MTVAQSQQVFTIKSIIKILAEKGIKFAFKVSFKDLTANFVGVDISQNGKFLRVNDKILPTQIVNVVHEFTNPVKMTKEQLEALND